jgi:hypothetical protein
MYIRSVHTYIRTSAVPQVSLARLSRAKALLWELHTVQSDYEPSTRGNFK